MKKSYVLILCLMSFLFAPELQAQVKFESENNSKNTRIKNGEDVLIENHPYQADLSGCGGTIIGPTWILTAEHCVGGMVGRKIGVGYTKRSDRSTGQTSVVKRVINFPCSGCDLSLLELETPLDLSGKYAKAIKYASADVFTYGYVKRDMECYATGWGQLGPNGGTPDHLQGALLKFGNVQLSDERIRVEETEGRMVCRGDSGGPLVVYNGDRSERILVGAVSGGEGTPCTDYGFWGNVANAASWIEQQTGIKPYKEGGSTPDTQAPSAPANLAASNPTQTTINLSWSASTDNIGVTGYDVYRGNTVIGTTANTTYRATGLTASTTYSFSVKAKDAAGNVSVASNVVTAATTETGSGSHDVKLTIVFDNYPAETSWEIKNANNQVVHSGGNYDSQTSGSTIDINKTLDAGCYTLVFKDTYGDGICCSYGNGSYELTNLTTGAVLASGGAFTTEDTKNFCVDGSNATSKTSDSTLKTTSEFFVYPSPANNFIIIQMNNAKDSNFKIVNQIGQVVRKGEVSKNKVELSDLPSGLYFVSVKSGDKTLTKKFILK
jgi:chitodextrinase